ncbi:MAG: c-type cytochrome [Armatimonadetes bacterium]|nr:c-type cytochrome [Armatimonadota bacterium]
MERASYLYFDRCAGCHGVLRKGATGPALTVKETSEIGQGMLRSFISDGTEAGMPAFLQEGILSAEEVDLLSRFLLKEPPSPPEMSMEKIKQSWKVAVPPDQRPKAPLHTRNWQNFMGVVLRDAGKVAIIDGDTKELVSLIGTGHAVHILRSSATGRYFYSIGRDGKVTLIDLWMNPPQMVAELKVCYDARSVESSKYKGPAGDFLDRYLVVGGYWPPLLAVLDGQTLEPLKLLSTRGYTYDSGEYVQEARVASIVASHHDPLWVVNIKETGQTWLVDYSDIKNLKVCMIETERFLHDGGWESTKRYFIVAANMRDRLAVVDTVDRKLVTLVDVGTKPHPGRGANLVHPEFGPLWCTGHLGDNSLAFIGTDPVNYPQHAWKVVARPRMPGDAGGNLFVKTHPGSKWIFADRPLAPDPAQNRKIYVFDKNTLQFAREIEIPVSYARAKPVHFDFNKAGDEIWVSLWGASKTEPTAILIYDQATLNLKHEIKGDWVITPTGHFNVHNTAGDVY